MNIANVKVNGVEAVSDQWCRIPAGIVGATVSFQYTGDIWASLRKTVVFRSVVIRDVIDAGEIVAIPPEVVAESCSTLCVGVYGVDAQGKVVIPTLWAELGEVLPAADPSGDQSTDPALPVWAQLQEEVAEANAIAKGRAKGHVFDTVEDLDLWLAEPAHVAELAVGDNFYIRALDVPDYWWDGTQKQPLETQKVELSDYVKSGEVEDTVNKALQEAKESGEFKGDKGDKGDTPYTYLSSPDASKPVMLYGLANGLYVLDGWFRKNAHIAAEKFTPDMLWTVGKVNGKTWLAGLTCAASVCAWAIGEYDVTKNWFDLFNMAEKNKLDLYVKQSLANNPHTMSSAEKTAACKWLGTLNVIENANGSITAILPSGKSKTIDLSKIEIFL